MPATAARVFTIPASVPFLPTLIQSLVRGALVPGFEAARDPLALAPATVYLPTRRACRLARHVFLEALAGDAAILPRIVPIGDIDEDELAFAEVAAPGAEALRLPPPLDPLERRILLARLVMQWAGSPAVRGTTGAPLVAQTPATALALADDLARLIDDMTTRQVPWDQLDRLVPANLDQYWALTLQFLQIAREHWPQVLAQQGLMEPAERRNRLIAAEAARLARSNAPVVAAGSTGSIPATAALLKAIAALPHGAVVLPGLDTDLDAPSWELIAGSIDSTGRSIDAAAIGHPQFAMHALLRELGISRDAVPALAPPALHGRERLVSEAFRPAASTELWRNRLPEEAIARTLSEVSVVTAANEEEEALAISIALRETVEDESKVAALVTPDRGLASRVIAQLGRWSITVEDSRGEQLLDTPAGVFARLAAEAGIGGLAPVSLLALLKHPMLRLGGSEGRWDYATTALERALLRGPRPRPGAAGLAQALETFRAERKHLHRRDSRRFLSDNALDAAAELIERLSVALAPFAGLDGSSVAFGTMAARHCEVVAALSSDHHGSVAAFAGEDGEALLSAFDDLAALAPADDLATTPADYLGLLAAVLSDRVVRKASPPAARVIILGLLEARLQNIDRVVLGGLIESIWPPQPNADPWLSRPMRQDLGLDLPERRIGLSAHDFAQALGAPEVVLTYAAKTAGAPTVPSRFLQRLRAVCGEREWEGAVSRGDRYLRWARNLDRPITVQPIKRPEPKPPRDVRPAALSVTEIEDWLRDPYTIYARHVLRLVPLDAIDTPPGAADRGNAIHEAIGDFTRDYADDWPADPVAELLASGRKHFAPLRDYPEAEAFWWPRFERVARWFASWAHQRRAGAEAVLAEISGKLEIPLGEHTLLLSARADRIERIGEGQYAILDYKTGQPRTEGQVRAGLAPQLTLEAAILRQGGFRDIPAGASVAELAYVVLKGGDPAGRECPIEFRKGTVDSQAERALARLTALAQRFDNDAEPYRSLVHPMWKTHYGVYDHLARVKEWSATAGAVDEADT